MKQHSFKWLRLGAFAAIAMTTAVSGMGQCNTARCTGKIGRLFVASSNGKPVVYINFTGLTPPRDMHALNCTLASNTYATLQSNHPNFDKIFSVLEQSKMFGKIVQARVIEGTTNCAISYVVVDP